MRPLVIIALLGGISSLKLESHHHHKYRPNTILSPWAAKPEAAPPATKITGAFRPQEDWIVYDRKVPDHWAGAGDDKLMESLIKKYAVEGNTHGAPNGEFYLTRNGVDSVAREVVSTHLSLSGEELDSFLNTRVPKVWAHFDVLNEGFLDVAKVPSLLRMLVGEVNINNNLQVQLETETDAEYRPNVVQSPWAEKKEDKKEKEEWLRKYGKKTLNAFGVHSAKARRYERETPERYDKDGDDTLMKSLIDKYAVEGNTDKIHKGKGDPNGKFYVDKANLYAASQEVVNTHLGLDGEKRDKFVDSKFDSLFSHYDVNQEGYLEVERAPMFLRQILGENEISSGLQ